MKCSCSSCNNEVIDRSRAKKKQYCSKRCSGKYHMARKREELKIKAVVYLGGKCQICGYSRCYAALEFHHRDPSKKDFGIAYKGAVRAWEIVKKELDKCDLLCSNCHKELHFNLKRQNCGVVQ